MSSVPGFDIAVLRVKAKSRDGSVDLPARLDFALQEVSEQIQIAVIGYPGLDYLQGTPFTLATMSKLRVATPQVAKYISPGEVLSDEARASFHVLVHIGATHAGNSGSPVFSLNPVRVVGIHYCCTGVDDSDGVVSHEVSGDCSSTANSNLHANEAISAVDAKALVSSHAAAVLSTIRQQRTALQFAGPNLPQLPH